MSPIECGTTPSAETIATRRIRDPRELFESWLSRDIPLAVAEQLILYAATFGLDLSRDSSDCFPLRQNRETYMIVVRWSGIERICRGSGLWLPGRSRICELAGELLIEGSCYLRARRDSDHWYEVSDVARYGSHHERDYESDDLGPAPARGEWALIPELKLSEIAQYLAAAKALGELVTCHETSFKHPSILVHRDVINERRRATAGTPSMLTP